MAPRQIAIRLNGGFPGNQAIVAANSTVTATLDSIDGINVVAWDMSTTDDTTLSPGYTLVTTGDHNETCTVSAKGLGTAAVLRAVANGAIDPSTNQPSPGMIATAKFAVATGAGLEVGCTAERTETDPLRGTSALINAAIRAVDGLFGSSIIRIATATPSTLSPGMTAYVDNGGDGAPAALMPPSPPDGALCRVVDTTHRFGAAPYTVNANSGQTIEDPGSPGTYGASCVLSVASCAVQWMYNLALTQWKVV